jgi:hypothetical protein
VTAPGLRRFVARPLNPERDERCELCAEPIEEDHRHLADLTTRAVLCACRACHLLFPDGAGRYRAIPDRYRYAPNFRLSTAQWEELNIPVRLVFVFHHSGQDEDVAFYPSPAGATESLLPMRTWARILTANPRFADAAPDVEAILLRRIGERVEGYLVPIDACYDLVGRVRAHWHGFGGGDELRAAVDAFFGRLAAISERVT